MARLQQLIICLLFSQSLFAEIINLGMQKETPHGKYQRVLTLKSKRIFLSKNTNYFDLDFMVGEYEAKDLVLKKFTIQEVKKIRNQLISINNKLKAYDKKYNDLINVGKHETLIYIDGFKITNDSEFFKPLYDLIEKNWSNKSIKKLNSMELVKNSKNTNNATLVYYKNGKKIKTKKIKIDNDCKGKTESFSTCRDNNYGSIIIK